MNPDTRDRLVTKIDALLGLLDSRLGEKASGWYHPQGLGRAWSDYRALRDRLIAGDSDHFGALPELREPPESEREAAGASENGRPVKSIRAMDLVTLRDAARQARTLIAGGESLERLGARERQRLENENLRLKNTMLLLSIITLIVGFVLGHIIR